MNLPEWQSLFAIDQPEEKKKLSQEFFSNETEPTQMMPNRY